MWNIPLEHSLLPSKESPLKEDWVACPLWRTLSTMVSLKIYLLQKLPKLQSRRFYMSRTQWDHACETSFILLYHQDMRCQAEIPC